MPITRVNEADLPWERFRDEFLRPGVPVIITHGLTPHAPHSENAPGMPNSDFFHFRVQTNLLLFF